MTYKIKKKVLEEAIKKTSKRYEQLKAFTEADHLEECFRIKAEIAALLEEWEQKHQNLLYRQKLRNLSQKEQDERVKYEKQVKGFVPVLDKMRKVQDTLIKLKEELAHLEHCHKFNH